MSRGIKAFALLLLGAAAGVAGSYFWHQNIPPPTVPVFTETKSNNIPLTAFEEGRREVDRDPDRYLLAKAASPQDAEDHYLLGRAQLLTGKYVEAMRRFALAKERLPQVDPANSKTLEAEIALARALVSTPEACEAFVKEITSPGSAVQNRNVNSNNAVPPVANP